MKRLAEDTLHRWLAARRRNPLMLRGARQVGKTTLVRAVRFDANPPSLQTVSHAIRTAEGATDVTARILSLPLYAVEALPRLLQALRRDARPGTRSARNEHPTD